MVNITLFDNSSLYNKINEVVIIYNIRKNMSLLADIKTDYRKSTELTEKLLGLIL
jgi:hypothetical protein